MIFDLLFLITNLSLPFTIDKIFGLGAGFILVYTSLEKSQHCNNSSWSYLSSYRKDLNDQKIRDGTREQLCGATMKENIIGMCQQSKDSLPIKSSGSFSSMHQLGPCSTSSLTIILFFTSRAVHVWSIIIVLFVCCSGLHTLMNSWNNERNYRLSPVCFLHQVFLSTVWVTRV